MVKIIKSGQFNQLLDELYQEDPQLELIVIERIKWFSKNPKDTRLGNHALTKKMEGRWAFSITDDIRIVYKWTSSTTVRFILIGPHAKVYPTQKLPKQSPKR